MQEMIWMPLRSGATMLKSIIHQRSYSSLQHLYLKSYGVSQSKVVLPCIANTKYDSRSFCSTHNYQKLHSSLLETNSSTLDQETHSTNDQPFPSVALHNLGDVNSKLPLRFFSLTSCARCDNFKLLNQELSTQSQIRFLREYSSRRRVSRSFSSEEKTSANKVSEQNGDKEVTATGEDDDKKLSVFQRFKKAYKEHGKVLVVVHLLTSTVWYGSFYAAARCGVDIVPLLEQWNMSEKVISPFRSGGLGDFALAYLLYKLATPARYTVTLGGTNLALRYLKKEGKIQPVAEEDKLRVLYKDGKADLKTRNINRRSRGRKIERDAQLAFFKNIRYSTRSRLRNNGIRLRNMGYNARSRLIKFGVNTRRRLKVMGIKTQTRLKAMRHRIQRLRNKKHSQNRKDS